MIPLGDMPISRGKNLKNLRIYCTKITFIAKFAPEDPKEFGRTINIIICQYLTAYC
jgi:hypothetical protein